LGKVDCPCCKHKKFEWLEGQQGSQTTSLCGRNAVQISQRNASRLNFDEMARHLKEMGGTVSFNRFLLKFNVDSYEFTVFPDGRAIIKGTSDLDKARTLYAQYVGH
jgi:molybdopterin-synthase adenylyltransferase